MNIRIAAGLFLMFAGGGILLPHEMVIARPAGGFAARLSAPRAFYPRCSSSSAPTSWC